MWQLNKHHVPRPSLTYLDTWVHVSKVTSRKSKKSRQKSEAVSCQYQASCLQPVCKGFLTSGKTDSCCIGAANFHYGGQREGWTICLPLTALITTLPQGYPAGNLCKSINKANIANIDRSVPTKSYIKIHSMGKAVDEFARLFMVSVENRV